MIKSTVGSSLRSLPAPSGASGPSRKVQPKLKAAPARALLTRQHNTVDIEIGTDRLGYSVAWSFDVSFQLPADRRGNGCRLCPRRKACKAQEEAKELKELRVDRNIGSRSGGPPRSQVPALKIRPNAMPEVVGSPLLSRSASVLLSSVDAGKIRDAFSSRGACASLGGIMGALVPSIAAALKRIASEFHSHSARCNSVREPMVAWAAVGVANQFVAALALPASR